MTISFHFGQDGLICPQPKEDCLYTLGRLRDVSLLRDASNGDIRRACQQGLDGGRNPTLSDNRIVFAIAMYWGIYSEKYAYRSAGTFLTYEVSFKGQPYAITCSRVAIRGKRDTFDPISIIKIPSLTSVRMMQAVASQPASPPRNVATPGRGRVSRRPADNDGSEHYNSVESEHYNNIGGPSAPRPAEGHYTKISSLFSRQPRFPSPTPSSRANASHRRHSR
jgi:hypothetical protein